MMIPSYRPGAVLSTEGDGASLKIRQGGAGFKFGRFREDMLSETGFHGKIGAVYENLKGKAYV